LADASAARTQTMSASADRMSRDLTALLDALARVRQDAELPDVLDRAGRELCAAMIFDRVMVSRVSGSTWLPLALYAACDDGHLIEIDEPGVGVEGLEVSLASPLVEAEVVRRRLPALVQDAANEPRAHQPLVERTGTRDYVVAPVVAGNSVIGLLRAGNTGGERPLTAMDCDLLRMFADGVGLVYERADLTEREERQSRTVAEVCEAAERTLHGLESAPILELRATPVRTTPGRESKPVPRAGRDPKNAGRDTGRLARLTAREREVLALLAGGATNAQLADRLTVAESTVKSHVKHILHKLGARNRTIAIACYLRDDERRLR
jgi:DNA-binding CsgD family transcriptional regulator